MVGFLHCVSCKVDRDYARALTWIKGNQQERLQAATRHKQEAVMDRALRRTILDLLDTNRIATIATNRPDGWPQATIVGYANDAERIYVIVARAGQKYANIQRDNRVSLAVGGDTPDPMRITGLSMAARASEVTDGAESQLALALMLGRYPEYAGMAPPDENSIALLRIVPEVVSVLDYSKGFGHADLVRWEAEAAPVA
jgi:nitroimidazol reductase NimA-like FMN-containing flavoprotein (pyridoxamine 5'-phosphate oxidase superfamily)